MPETTVEIGSITRSLSCELTTLEMLGMVKELSIVLEGLARETDRQKSLKKSMASTIADLEQRRADLASKITLGRENRDVAVAMLADYVAGTVTEVRQDTFEVVRSRPLRDDEKQVPLPVEAPPAERADHPTAEGPEEEA